MMECNNTECYFAESQLREIYKNGISKNKVCKRISQTFLDEDEDDITKFGRMTFKANKKQFSVFTRESLKNGNVWFEQLMMDEL